MFPAAVTGCKPQSITDTLQLRIKLTQMGTGIPFAAPNDSSQLNDIKSSGFFNSTLHYNEAGQLVKTAITIVNLKEIVNEMTASLFSGFPAGVKEDVLDNSEDVSNTITLRKEIYFEFAYNDAGQLIQMIMPKFPAVGTPDMKITDDTDTIRVKYDSLGRIIHMDQHATMSTEAGLTSKKEHRYTTVSVDYPSETAIRCTAVSTYGRGTAPEKSITDFNFNSKGNLVKATRKKVTGSGAVQLVNETVYSYYENIKNPEYYALNKHMVHAFTIDNSSRYPNISVNCLKKAIQRNADGGTDTTIVSNVSFDANKNIVRYVQENESKLASNQVFKNYTYKNCSTGDASEEDGTNPVLTGVKDIDGNVYQAIKIGNQVWMTEDLRVTHFRNGDSIPEVAEPALWKYILKSAYNKNNAQGYLYNWHAINDPRNIAPAGWHVATDAEWNTLIKTLGGASVAGGALKDGAVWTDNQATNNESGFRALPAGKINSDQGLYELSGKEAYYWIKSPLSANDATATSFNIKSSGNFIELQKLKKTDGLSVRCIKD
ncbi:MAG: fibrobacter succinogenes major paralogous domain-containing protein [Agriterribacter sp.]